MPLTPRREPRRAAASRRNPATAVGMPQHFRCINGVVRCSESTRAPSRSGAGLRGRPALTERGRFNVGASVMFLDCPAYMDKSGSVRCGLPAEVEGRYLRIQAARRRRWRTR